MEGWVKIHRKMLDNPIVCKDSEHLSIWIYLLLNATHKEIPALFKGKKIFLQPGQLITGRKLIAKKLDISESKVKRTLLELESDQQIVRERSNQNSLISIVNWIKYQANDQQNDQQMTSQRPASDHKQECNNNYIYLLNKYKRESKGNMFEYMSHTREMRADPKWDTLTREEQSQLMSEV